MTSRISILAVEIDDSQFKAFQEKFDAYKADAEKMPGAWAATDEQVKAIKGRYEQMLAAARQKGEADNQSGETTEKVRGAVHDATAFWVGMFTHSHRIGRGIASATADLAKWSRLTAVFSGLVGAGGLFGLNTLAAGIANKRQTASGIGVSIGERGAALADFERFGDVDTMLRGLSDTATHVEQRQPLASLGVNPQGKNAAKLLPEVIGRIKDILDAAGKDAPATTTMAPYNIGALGISDDTLRIIQRMDRSEIRELQDRMPTDVRSMEVSDADAKSWQDFRTSVLKAEAQIGTSIADSLINIEPGLTKLSGSAVLFVNNIMASKGVTEWLHSVGSTMSNAADSLGSAEVLAKIAAFNTNAKGLKDDLDAIEGWMSSHASFIALFATSIAAARFGSKFGPVGTVAGLGTMGVIAGAAVGAELLRSGVAGPPLPPPKESGTLGDELGLPGVNEPPSGNVTTPGIKAAPADVSGQTDGDLSKQATYGRQNEHVDPAALIVHHTGGRGSPEGVVNTLNQRGLGVQFVMDRDGKVYRALPDGSRGAHILPGDVDGLHLSNSNTVGMEVIANDDSDVTPDEVKGSKDFFKRLQNEYPGIKVFGHGYVNPGHKQATEGQTITNAIRRDEGEPEQGQPRDAKQAVQEAAKGVPLEKRTFMGGYQTGDTALTVTKSLQHPNSRPPATQSVTVHDNTGGSSTVEIAH